MSNGEVCPSAHRGHLQFHKSRGLPECPWTGEGLAKQLINYGPIREATGCGIFFQAADMDGNGLLDVVGPGKDGLYLFKNLGHAEVMGD